MSATKLYGIVIGSSKSNVGAKSGWDDSYVSRSEAEAAQRRALSAGHQIVQIVSIDAADRERFGWRAPVARG